MKALSVVERAGRLITSGTKTLEIRHWSPEELPLLNLAIIQNSRRLTPDDPIDPDGQLVAVVDVRNVREWKEDDPGAPGSTWERGWLAWELDNIRVVENGPKVPAERRIFSIDSKIADLTIRRP